MSGEGLYLSFYGLKEKPFGPTPDPKFLYRSPTHQEALAQLVYAVRERRGFMVLTGEVGTGKTTLLQTLLRHLDGAASVAYVFNTMLPFDGILEYALEDLGVTGAGESRAQRLIALNGFLLERHRAGQTTVLLLDEAHNLGVETLEQIRLLSNYETPTEKLLQIILFGQPELRATLDRPELRQLKQRIGLRATIGALTPDETGQYVRHRLQVAGGRDLGIFEEEAIDGIVAYAGGIPRVINLVCEHCLLVGFADHQTRIGPEIVEEAVRYLEDGDQPKRAPRARARLAGPPPRWAIAAGITAVIGAGLAMGLQPGGLGEALGTAQDSLINLVHLALAAVGLR